MAPVFTLHMPRGPERPLVFDSPHSGLQDPPGWRVAAPREALTTSWDAFVEELFGAAPDHGATLLEAHCPRAFIDLNRNRLDIDPELLAGPWPGELRPGRKSEQGMGLIRRLALPGVPVYAERLAVQEVADRIATYYDPYHDALKQRLDALHGRFGAVWHVNCHSMKSRGNAMNDDAGQARPDFVVSDRDGTTADPAFTRWAADALSRLGYRTSINHPYKGAELVRAFGDPQAGRHSIQIEVNRALYMDEKELRKNEGFAKVQRDLAQMIAEMALWAENQARKIS